MKPEKSTVSNHYDIAIIGAGVVGLCAAILLKKAGLSVCLIGETASAPQIDNRAIAIMNGQWHVLETVGVADAILPHSTPLQHLVIIDDTKRLLRAPTIQFSANEIEQTQFARNVPMANLFEALHEKLKAQKIKFIKNEVQSIERNQYFNTITFQSAPNITANLIIASDGKTSTARILADIPQVVEKLAQTALSFTVHHELPHNNTSFEFHTRTGPITFVPIHNQNQCNCIWTVDEELKHKLLTLNNEDFNAEFSQITHQILGDCVKISPINSWKLQISRASIFGKNRTALVGDAAHSFPPIGAQGLNLGLRDVAQLLETITNSRNLGLDIGAEITLNQYSNARKSDIFTVVSAVNALNFSLISNNPFVTLTRSAGLMALKTMPKLRKAVVSVGMKGI